METVTRINVLHDHPQDTGERVFGHRLQSGDLRETDDVYDSRIGRWENIPTHLVGTPILQGDTRIYIRPCHD